MSQQHPPRLVPNAPLPPYSYVTGRQPHPTRDPAGHSYAHAQPAPGPAESAQWATSRDYLYGCDLFNHGYYWEAHEAWEGLWHAAGRRGPTAILLKALIKLAAAGVKAREGRAEGVARHAARAAELLAEVSRTIGDRHYWGLDLQRLLAESQRLAQAPLTRPWAGEPVAIVFAFRILPEG